MWQTVLAEAVESWELLSSKSLWGESSKQLQYVCPYRGGPAERKRACGEPKEDERLGVGALEPELVGLLYL